MLVLVLVLGGSVVVVVGGSVVEVTGGPVEVDAFDEVVATGWVGEDSRTAPLQPVTAKARARIEMRIRQEWYGRRRGFPAQVALKET